MNFKLVWKGWASLVWNQLVKVHLWTKILIAKSTIANSFSGTNGFCVCCKLVFVSIDVRERLNKYNSSTLLSESTL